MAKHTIIRNVERMCRICFEEACEFTNLFTESIESKDIMNQFYQCFQLVVEPDECLPCALCKKCREHLNIAYRFRQQCLTIHERFQHYCGSTATKVSRSRPSSFNLDVEGNCFEESQFNSCEKTNYVLLKTEENMFVCDVCKKALRTKKSLLKHIVSMHEKRRHAGKITGYGSTRQYHCTTCSYSTPHSQTLVNHMRRHNGERPYNCHCGKSFTQASSLAAHRKTHSNTTYYTCSECGKQFKHAFSLKTHLQVHSSGIYSCEICSRVLKSKRSLSNHMDRHNKVFNYNCEDCGNTFVTSAELQSHKMKHWTSKTINCHICDYAAHSKKILVVHLKRHQGDKCFKCNLCEKAFLTDGILQRHMRVHTREKPFSCHTCSQRFAYSTSLNNHMLAVHGVKYKWGEVKLKESRMKVPLKTEID